jgi:hypothetical protein
LPEIDITLGAIRLDFLLDSVAAVPIASI